MRHSLEKAHVPATLLLLLLCSCATAPTTAPQQPKAPALAPTTKHTPSPAETPAPGSPSVKPSGEKPAQPPTRSVVKPGGIPFLGLQGGDPASYEASVEKLLGAWEELGCVGRPDEVFALGFAAYEEGRGAESSRWFGLARWLQLMGMPEDEYLRAWGASLSRNGLLRPEMIAMTNGRRGVSLAMRLSPELRRELPRHPECLEEMADLISSMDHQPAVYTILSELRREHPGDFWDYFSLAAALAVVRDVPPPANWPHGQMPSAVAGRFGATPSEVFGYLVALDRAGRTLQPLRELSARVLVHVADTSVGVNQLRWARLAVTVPLEGLPSLYPKIRYDGGRIASQAYKWPGSDYTLPLISQRGGICVDQAFWCVEAGKACGVPTVLYAGRGTSGRHAWFGYLGKAGKWVSDAGRGREQRFAAGMAVDPQSWGPVSEQIMRFQLARDRAGEAGRGARIHLNAAVAYALDGRFVQAERAARCALAEDKRCLPAWEFLANFLATPVAGKPAAGPEQLEALYLQGAEAFRGEPDMELNFLRKAALSLQKRGRVAEAGALLREFTRRVGGKRSDLSIRQDALLFSGELEGIPPDRQVARWEAELRVHAKASAITAFDAYVVPFVHMLASTGRGAEARACAAAARVILQPKKGSQLDKDLEKLLTELK